MSLLLLCGAAFLAGLTPSGSDDALTMKSPAQIICEPASDDAEKIAVAASNGFGIELYRSLCKAEPNKNLFLSPYSMSIALTMTAEGARRETEQEMSRVLHFPTAIQDGTRSVTDVHGGYAALSKRFHDAAGSSDPKTRARIDTLVKQLNKANATTKSLERQDNWKEARESQAKATKIADELNALLTQVDRFDLRVANALWVERTFSLVPEYVKTIDRFYGTGGVTSLNIAGDTEKSRLRINGWVEENTEHRIKDLIPSGALTADARLVITNAVYFKGQWADPFEENSTRNEDFTLAGGGKVQVKMMQDHWRGSVPYAAFTGAGEYFETPREVPVEKSQRPPTYPDDHGFQMIDLPYKGGELSMVVITPRLAGGLAELESRLTAASLDSWLKRLESRTVDTAMPRFKMESQREMSPVLKEMGMKRAFISPDQPQGAQFTGMSTSEDPAQQLFIGAVLHKAWVEVTEKGTEAAAATAVVMATASAVGPREMMPFNPVFRADHPFIFLIRDTKSGVILFMGRMMEPKG